ncbi:MFS transporter [Streptomyces phaeochromogenes]|uniref:MFS transporter n=1 Tax=Streptomyces phaeochromogenes TaxID=1923 RepID=A0ABZ1H3A4_STRPH|nr:MFS transporter [Streptomyces phaeochromogenes]MCX5602144.1 MFS transporter [Streptomyces phaeochromogenes]WRZ27071.1 MFS transporter [Streptomyces phaeochromogenes]WSD12635.1 MFS transporter [Streptomyces phaeochromogenes]WSJ10569.1 MFS transporter [Streptomyces phaeochromogenes]WTA02129.1 MFS transporter [Streptomyces phaeochromogenes]
MSTVAAQPVPNTVDPKTARKVTLAGCVGIFAELYDNGIFGFMAGTLAVVFFPNADNATAVQFVFLGYAVSFFFRPLGGIICGHLGDRIGRQRMLVFVIMLISVATAAIGILPTYASIGIAAPALLILLRVAQGFSVGGEASGAMSFLAEHAPEGKRGLYTSYAQIASFLSLLTGTLIAAAMTSGLGQDRMESWGWRIPFLLAVPLGITGIYIRKRISDTPNFTRLKETGGLSKNPLKEAFSSPEHRRAMLLALFIPLMNGSGYYVLFSYMPTFMNTELDFSKVQGLLVTATSLVAISIAIPYMGSLSDRIGRKKVLAGAAVAMAIAGIPCYLLIGTGSVPLAILGACIMAVIFAGHTGVIHVMLVELFPTRVRYSAYGLGYNVSAALFGGTAPLLMTYLIDKTGNVNMPAFYAVVTSLGTLIAVSRVKDRAHLPLRDA